MAWQDLKPGDLCITVDDQGYSDYFGLDLPADRRSRFFSLWLERGRAETLLRFVHDDGTPVGALLVHMASSNSQESNLDWDDPGRDGTKPYREFSCRLMTGSQWEVSAACEDGYRAQVTLEGEAEPLGERTIQMSPPAAESRTRACVRAVYDETGEPVAGATVVWRGTFWIHWPYGARGQTIERNTVTDAEGVSVIENPPAGDATVFARADGWCGIPEDVILVPSETCSIDLVLARTERRSIRGIYPNRPRTDITLLRDQRQIARKWGERAGGTFVFDGLEEGTYTVVAEDPDSGDTFTSAAQTGGEPVRVQLPPAGRIVLDCKDADGRVLTDVGVTMERDDWHGEKPIKVLADGDVVCSPPLSEGPARIRVSAPGYWESKPVPVYVTADVVTRVAVSLGHPLPVLDVEVLDPTGAPLHGVMVRLESTRLFADEGELTNLFAPGPHQPLLRRTCNEHTALDGWARFVWEPDEVTVWVAMEPRDDDAVPLRRVVELPATGRVTASFVVQPRPMVRTGDGAAPAPLADGDILLEWDGWPLRLAEEVPSRWTEPVVVRVARDGTELTATLEPMSRDFYVTQALLPVR